MVNEDSLTVTYLHGSSKTTFRVKPHGHLPWVLQRWPWSYLLLLHRPPSRVLQRWPLKLDTPTHQYKSSLLSPKSLLGEANFKVPTRVKNSSSICYCFRDHPLKGSSKMVSEDSLTVTYLHGSSKTTFRVKPHGHLPWVLQSWSPIYLLLLHRPPSRVLQRWPLKLEPPARQ